MGLIVREVTPNSPAAKAGMKRGDKIVQLEGKEVKDFDQFVRMLNEHKPGHKVMMRVMREGKEEALAVTLGEMPRQLDTGPGAGFGLGARGPFLGVQTAELTEEMKNRLGVTAEQGAAIMDIVPGSPAAKAGLRRGDVILSIGKQKVTGPMDLREAIRAAGTDKEVTLKIARGKEEKEIHVQLAATPGEGIAGPRGFPQGLNPAVFQQIERLPDLERRIQELENRIRALEQKLKEKSGESR
jgi:serine protease Do